MSTTAQRVLRENEERVVGLEVIFFLFCVLCIFFKPGPSACGTIMKSKRGAQSQGDRGG